MKLAGLFLGRAGNVAVAKGVTVHSRVGQGGEGQRRVDVFREHLADAVQQGFFFGVQRLKAGHDAFIGLLHAEHVLIGVAMPMAMGVGRRVVLAVLVTSHIR